MIDDKSRVTKRPARVPVHKAKLIKAKEIPGYRTYICNDLPGRIQMFIDAGWEHVYGEENNVSDKTAQTVSQVGSPVRYRVNIRPDAPCQWGYLMKIPLELWEEDQHAQQVEREEAMAQIDPAKYKQGDADYGSLSIKRN